MNFAWSNSDKHGKTPYNIGKDDVVLLDGFDANKEDVDYYTKKGNKVIAYISVGSIENWRPDINVFPKKSIGEKYNGWAGERWFNVSNWELLKPGMESRFDMIKEKGFIGYEGDNVMMDSKYNRKHKKDNINYAKWLAETAHVKGLTAIFKNGVDLIDDIEPYYDGVIVEEAMEYDETKGFKPFSDSGKPTWFFEYEISKNKALNMKLDWMSDVLLDTSSGWLRI